MPSCFIWAMSREIEGWVITYRLLEEVGTLKQRANLLVATSYISIMDMEW